MISVAQALGQCLSLVRALPSEEIALLASNGRYLAAPVTARLAQPPCDVAAMDGYALSGDPAVGAQYHVVGQAGAGHPWGGVLEQGQALRIFTGAAVPQGASRVVIQEDVTRAGDVITVLSNADHARHIRAQGSDFAAGASFAPRLLRPADLGLLAAMDVGFVPVTRRPVVALIPTGDELVMPGAARAAGQITASSVFALAAIAESAGAQVQLLPISGDDLVQIKAALRLAQDADVIVTTGGASVGDHDLVGRAFAELGVEQAFWKIAMRPGKPLMAGRWGDRGVLGLPGNPVSAVVCGHLFLLPMIRALLGYPPSACGPVLRYARLAQDVAENGPRAHYMRARLSYGGGGQPYIHPFAQQDSALLSVLAEADALLIRPPHDLGQTQGAQVAYIAL